MKTWMGLTEITAQGKAKHECCINLKTPSSVYDMNSTLYHHGQRH